MTIIEPDARFKIVIFGDGGVGKTTLINRYLSGLFNEDFKMTIGVDFQTKKLEDDEYLVQLSIWDFSGEERFRFLISSYLEGASGGVFMYDITRYKSLTNLKNWYSVIKEANIDSDIFPIILVGGKLDLEEYRAVDLELAHDYVKDYDLIKHVECSSKTGENVHDVFEELAKFLLYKVVNV